MIFLTLMNTTSVNTLAVMNCILLQVTLRKLHRGKLQQEFGRGFEAMSAIETQTMMEIIHGKNRNE